MKYIFQILIIVFCAENISAQNTYFKKRLECLTNEVDLNYGVLPIQNGYIVYGSLTYQSSNEYDAYLLKIDENGNPLDTVVFGYDTAVTEIKNLFKMPSGYLAVGHRRWFSEINRFNPLLIRFNENLDTLWTKSIIFGQDTLPFISQAIMCYDSTIAIVGNVSKDSVFDDFDIMFLKVDSIGNVLNYKKLGYLNEMDGAGSITQTFDKGFAIGAYTDFGHPLGYSYTIIYKLDSLGNQQWFRKWGRNDASNGGCGVMNLIDSTILVFNARPTQAGIAPTVNKISNLQKITYDNSLVWNRDYGISLNYYNYGIFPYYQKNDSTIFAVRNGGYGYRPIFTLIKNNGDVIWEQTHRLIYGDHIYGSGTFAPSDSGFIMSGFLIPCFGCGDTGTQDLFVIKTNCLGFADPPFADATTGSLDNFEVVLENNSQYFGTTYIYWGDGNSDTLYENSDTLIYHTYLSSGNFSASIIAEACGDTDTLQLNVVSSLVGISEHEKPKFRIYPNPADNFVNLQTDKTYELVEVYVYDITGKQIQYQKVTNADYVLLETSKLNSGIYLVEVKMNGSKTEVQKLIIE